MQEIALVLECGAGLLEERRAVEEKEPMTAEALRAYIITLRNARGLSQEALAESASIAPRTYIAWETGATADIKAPLFLRLMRVLGGSYRQLEGLIDADAEQARELALAWVRSPVDTDPQQQRIYDKFVRVIEVGEHDPDKLIRLVDRLRTEARGNPRVLDLIAAFLAGLQSQGS